MLFYSVDSFFHLVVPCDFFQKIVYKISIKNLTYFCCLNFVKHCCLILILPFLNLCCLRFWCDMIYNNFFRQLDGISTVVFWYIFAGAFWAVTHTAKQGNRPKASTDARCHRSLSQDICRWPRPKSSRGEHSRVLRQIRRKGTCCFVERMTICSYFVLLFGATR